MCARVCVCECEPVCTCVCDRWLYRCSAAICMFPSSVLSLPPSLSVTLTYVCFRFATLKEEGGREDGRKGGSTGQVGLRHVPRDERCARGSIFLTAGHGHRHKAQQNTDDNDAETENRGTERTAN